MIKIKSSFRTSIGRFTPYDYVRSIYIDVVSRDEDEREIILGKVIVNQVLIIAAKKDGQDLNHVFDADSQGLHDTFVALFRANGELHEELDITEPVFDLFFLSNSIFHPVLEPYVCGIVDAITLLFGEFSIFALWHDTTGLSDAKLAELGFRKIANSRLIFRRTSLLSPFNRQNPQGLEVPFDFQCSQDQEEWVLANWKNR